MRLGLNKEKDMLAFKTNNSKRGRTRAGAQETGLRVHHRWVTAFERARGIDSPADCSADEHARPEAMAQHEPNAAVSVGASACGTPRPPPTHHRRNARCCLVEWIGGFPESRLVSGDGPAFPVRRDVCHPARHTTKCETQAPPMCLV